MPHPRTDSVHNGRAPLDDQPALAAPRLAA